MTRNKGGVYVYQQMEKTLAEWLAETKPIPAKVLCWESDTGIIRMGDGKSMYKDLPPRISSGLSPRISETTGCWETYNIATKQWEDTGINPTIGTGIDGGKPSSVYTPGQVLSFGKITDQ
ncbi:hypothetical protein NBH15_07410 [Parabacteroides sp. W1-Q-101]|uniref:hypothetical protein n=1 Tax=Parabacteroides TaxID=375288 RepID=UPI0020307456|nr:MULTISPECIES: hypothetical protein [Parabacteroides]MCM0718106.1 hypothetical protein [Parabacteroides sp. W1-Q-101]